MKNKIFILLGPPGSGKTSVFSKFLTEQGIPKIVTTTDRNPREGEVHGEDYYFTDNFNKESMIEWNPYEDNLYGSEKKEVKKQLANNRLVHIILERNGVEEFLEHFGEEVVEVVYVYINPEDMVERMLKRGQSKEEIISRREQALKDKEFDNIDIADLVLVNKDGRQEENKKILQQFVKERAKELFSSQIT